MQAAIAGAAVTDSQATRSSSRGLALNVLGPKMPEMWRFGGPHGFGEHQARSSVDLTVGSFKGNSNT